LHLFLVVKHLDIKIMIRKEEKPKGVHVWLLLWKATKAMEAHAHLSIQALGMCLSDFAVLEVLLHKGPVPINTLGKKVLLTSGSMTAAVDRLERRGLVERKNDANDRRTRIVHLTEPGRTLIRKLFAEHERDMEKPVSCLTRDEMGSLMEFLRRLGREADGLTKKEGNQL
jgi:MarR family 2-MHQ and catechol resistance regulon transcriptional repressor